MRRELRNALVTSTISHVGDRGLVLDIGCGTGWVLAELRGAGLAAEQLYGLDALAPRIAAARERVPGAKLRVGDARSLPYEDGSFDAALLVSVLSSIEDARARRDALEEAARILKPGAIVAIYEPRLPTPGNRRTARVTRADLEATGAVSVQESVPLTVLPPLTRRLGPATEVLYPLLARVGALLTHRVWILRSEP